MGKRGGWREGIRGEVAGKGTKQAGKIVKIKEIKKKSENCFAMSSVLLIAIYHLPLYLN